MADVTESEREAITHWAHFGRPGSASADRYVPDSDERERLKEFVHPESGPWEHTLDRAQTLALLNGFPRGEMEDKWIVYSDEPTAEGVASVHFHRSWTGQQVFSVDLQLTESGSRVSSATWEMDAGALHNPSEQFAHDSFREVCRWVLGMGALGASATEQG